MILFMVLIAVVAIAIAVVPVTVILLRSASEDKADVTVLVPRSSTPVRSYRAA